MLGNIHSAILLRMCDNAPALLQGCDELLEQVHLAFDRMCNIKEFRYAGHKLVAVSCTLASILG